MQDGFGYIVDNIEGGIIEEQGQERVAPGVGRDLMECGDLPSSGLS